MAAAVVVLDQLTKTWALRNLADGPIDVIWSLQLNLTYNTGAAFSQGEGLGPYIGIAAAAVAIGLLWSGRTVPTRTGAVAVGLVLGGAAGNLADRAFRAGDGFLGGAVIDFIDAQWYPVFNVADMAVVGGALLLLFATARYRETEITEVKVDAENPVRVDETAHGG
ncbi:MAG: signal peptidase II [Acidimicrobiales bacterium]